MSDLNRPHENRLKRKFEGLLDRPMGADRPHNERPVGSRLEFMSPIPTDSILTTYRSMFTRVPEVMGEGTSLVCLQCANKFISSYPLASGIPECTAGSSQLHYEGFNILRG